MPNSKNMQKGGTVFREIERKFLVLGQEWRKEAQSFTFCQGYLYSSPLCLVRVRTEDAKAYLTIKGPKDGIGRIEFEYPIPLDDAQELLKNVAHQPLIYKIRHKVVRHAHTWEVDEFCGDNAGLIVAEIELKSEDESFEKPDWLGKEVTHDARYRNAALAREPYCTWDASLK